MFAVTISISAHAKLKVIASFSILGDIVKQVSGEHAEVDVIVGPDEDAHIFRPTPLTAKKIANADLIIINGMGFEGWITRLINASGYKGKVIVATCGILPLTADQSGTVDPHAWNDVRNVIVYVENITNGLCEKDPDNSDSYRCNSQHYIQKLRSLDNWIISTFKDIPSNSRRVITSHDAFQYFAKAYDITFCAPQGITTESEASAKDVANLLDLIVKENITAVFMENMTNPRLIQQIAKEAGVQIGGILYSDALSTADGPAATYISLMEHNVRSLHGAMRAGLKVRSH